jgi:hypothetical protein
MDHNLMQAIDHINEMDRRTYEYEHECVCCLDNEKPAGFDKGGLVAEIKFCEDCLKVPFPYLTWMVENTGIPLIQIEQEIIYQL